MSVCKAILEYLSMKMMEHIQCLLITCLFIACDEIMIKNVFISDVIHLYLHFSKTSLDEPLDVHLCSYFHEQHCVTRRDVIQT